MRAFVIYKDGALRLMLEADNVDDRKALGYFEKRPVVTIADRDFRVHLGQPVALLLDFNEKPVGHAPSLAASR